MRWKSALLYAATIVACGEGGTKGDPVDALVVVQETNLVSCVQERSYERTVTRTCDDMAVRVVVCSDSELCDPQLDALTEAVADCTNAEETFMASTTVACD